MLTKQGPTLDNADDGADDKNRQWNLCYQIALCSQGDIGHKVPATHTLSCQALPITSTMSAQG